MADNTTKTVDIASLMEDGYSQSSDKLRAARAIMNQTVPVLLLILGTFGNTMNLVLFCKRNLSAFNLFFIVLSVSDTCVLYTWLLPKWINSVMDSKIEEKSVVTCKLFDVFGTIFGLLSAWMVVAITSQRAVSVIWPHRVSLLCTTKKAVIYLICLIGFSFMIASSNLYDKDIVKHNGTYTCNVLYTSPEYEFFRTKIYPWLNSIGFALLPSALLVVSNSVLVWKVSRSVRTARATMATGQAGQVDSRAKKASSMTVTLIAVSLTFFLLTMPLSLYYIVFPYTTQKPDMGDTALAVNELVFDTLWHIWYANCTVNFYLYCLTGTRFRQQLRELFCVKADKRHRASTD